MKKSSRLRVALSVAMIGIWAFAEPTKKAKIAKPPKKIATEIEEWITKLGAEGFRTRREATRRLVEIGRFARPKGDGAEYPYTDYVVDRMKTLFKHNDPEVAGRARQVAAKLDPSLMPSTIDLSKLNCVMLPHFVDQKNDTLALIAEMYGTRVDWIKAANPKIRNDKQLRTFKEIHVPVEDLSAK